MRSPRNGELPVKNQWPDVSTRPASTLDAPPVALRVGEWEIAPELNQISRAGVIVRLEPKAIGLLVFLAQRSGEVVSREDLLSALWPGVVVGDNALTQVVTKLRKALGDTARKPTYIESISKRGYRLIAAVRPADRPSPPPEPVEVLAVPDSRVPSRRQVVAGAVAALAVASTVWFALRRTDDDAPSTPGRLSSPAAHKLPTVTVRPIEAIGGDNEKLIARGLTADLVSDLSKVSGLWVVSGEGAPGSAQPEGRKLPSTAPGHYALTGTLQSAGSTLRLQVRLVDADAGRELWSQRFEREVRDLFAVQDEMVRSILEQLPIKVSQAETESLARRYTRNVAAYEHFLRGQTLLLARRREQNELARRWYWKAIELDPAFARAYAGLALTHALAYQLGWEDEAALSRAVELAATAEQMDPHLPDTHWVIGFVETQRRRHADAIGHLQRALSMNPSYADAYALMGGIKTYTGQPTDGVALLRTALRLNPDAGSLYFLLLGRALYFVGDHEQARVNLEQALARNADNVEARIYMALVLAQLGDRGAAQWQADEIRVVEPDFSATRWLATYPMTDKRQKERLVQALVPLGL
jgi:DNA-binding winged helix-turn-helix (wHTH) protein/TolB-like protein/cytochrome c-type biogenesis protein CcmH/NrfG